MIVGLAVSSCGKRDGVAIQSGESAGLGGAAGARVPVIAYSFKEVPEVGGDEREAGTDYGRAFAGTG